jgi:hypothetical protein
VTPLYALLGLAFAFLVILFWVRDSARQRAKRRSLTVLSRASRARKLSECPPEFLARLRAAMHLSEESL